MHSTIQNLFSPRTPATVTMEYSGSDSDDDDEVAGESADKLPPMSAPQSTSRRASMNSAARSITPRTAASPRFFPATPRSLTSPAAGSGVAAVVALRAMQDRNEAALRTTTAALAQYGLRRREIAIGPSEAIVLQI